MRCDRREVTNNAIRIFLFSKKYAGEIATRIPLEKMVVMGGMDSGLQPSPLRGALTTFVRLSHGSAVLG